MTLGYFAPLPPARTGVADYAAALLRELRTHANVCVNADGDSNLYQVGNNGLHREIYFAALAKPGVVILHDAVLNHFLLGALNQDQYIEEFVLNYGEWHRQLASDLWRNRARSAADPRYFEYPMLKRLAEVSRAIIVHNPAAAEIVQRHAPGTRVVEIPHLFDPPALPSGYEVIRLRERLGVSAQAFLFGVFGHLRESKRLWSILRALDRLPSARLLVAGEFASSDLERAIAPALLNPRIIRTGYLSEQDFWLYASAVDCCINLRYPAAGESSGIAVRLMGIGKPVVLTCGPETSRFPEHTCIRIDSGAAETDMLVSFMKWLMEDPRQAHDIGRRARAHICEQHGLSRVASQVLAVCGRCGDATT